MSSNRYEIRQEIGKGGLGAVYKAFDTQLQREVAMKRVLSADKASAEEVDAAAQKLMAEAQTLSSLNHPNIVTVFDVGRDEQGGFVVMELLKGETLDETIERGVLTQEDFIEVVNQTMEALIAAQAANVLHRDLKPGNVMVIWQPSGRFQTKILDFGLAKFSRTPSVQTMDQEDAVMGSIFFMAPEQFERGELDYRTDLYQMGCVYYFALTGHYPFNGDTAPAVMNAHLQHRVTPLRELRPDLSPSICDWVMWLISRDLNDRPRDSREAIQRFPQNPEPPPPEIIATAVLVDDDDGEAVPVVRRSTGRTLVTGPPRRTTGVHTAKPVVRATGAAPTRRPPPTFASAPRGVSTPIHPATGGAISVQPEPSKKGLYITLGVVGGLVLLGVGWVVSGNMRASADRERLRDLAEAQSPAGDPAIVRFAVDFLERPEATNEQRGQAISILRKATGAGVDDELLAQIRKRAAGPRSVLLIDILASRGTEAVVPLALEQFKALAQDREKMALLDHVQPLCGVAQLDDLLGLLRTGQSSVVAARLEGVVLAVIQKAADPGLADRLLARVDAATKEERQSLFRMLGQLGGETVLGKLQSIFSGSDQALQSDATAALLNWPDMKAMPLLEEAISKTQNPSLKAVAARAFVRLSGLPAPLPITDRIAMWTKALDWIGNTGDANLVFAAALDYPAAETQAFLKEQESKPVPMGNTAKQASGSMARTIQDAPTLGDSDLLMPSERAVRGQRGSLVLTGQPSFYSHWDSPGTYFVWHFKLKSAADYSVEVVQAYGGTEPCDFEVLVRMMTLPGRADGNGNWTEFKPVRADGKVTLGAGVVYSLVLRSKGAAPPRLMDVQGVRFTTK